MANASLAATSTRPRGDSSAVSGAAAIGWLLAFILLEWARGKWLLAAPSTPAGLLGAVSALEGLEVFLIVRMFNWRARGPNLGAIEAPALLALIAFAGVVLSARPFFAAGVLALFILCRFGRSAEHRALAIAVFAFIAQYLLQAGPFIWLHALVGRIDAAVLRWVLPRFGYDVTGHSTFVVRASRQFSINVLEGCASSYVASVAIPGFVIVVLALRGRLQRSDLGYAIALLAAIVLVNWLRLAPIALSREGWLYWHQGAGGAIVAAADGVLVVGLAYLATRRRREAALPG
ncbi:MAG TPA: hypothetical protein VHS81_13745 [Caulobacteraceae bacterium]|nr:hypothetical protein [Caulobacteraceae bacterium]